MGYTHKRRKDLVDYLTGQDAYTLYKPTRLRFARRRTYSKGIGDLYQIDLLNCIDVFTKRAWAMLLKTKNAQEVGNAFKRIMDDRPCNMVQSDNGTEFVNSMFQSMLRRRGNWE